MKQEREGRRVSAQGLWRASSVLGLASALMVAPVAQADETATPMQQRWNRLLAVELTGGVDGPFGVFGAAVVVAPVTNFGFELGGGVSRDGARVAGGLRFMFPQDHFAFVTRLGLAGGPLTWDSPGFQYTDPVTITPTGYGRRRSWDFAGFAYGDIGLQYRFDMGLYIQANFGVEASLSPTSDTCSFVDVPSTVPTPGCSRTDGGRTARLYLGLSLGYAFDFLGS